MKLQMNFNHIKAERESGKEFTRDTIIEYPVDLYIKEVQQEDDRTVVSFKMQTKTNPETANFTLSGDLLLEGTEEEVGVWTTPSTRSPPKVWKHIYQESMNILSVIAKLIDVPFPTPEMGGIKIEHGNYE